MDADEIEPAPAANWPTGSDYPDDQVVVTACGGCGLGWRVHVDMAGYRVRCRCGAWVDVPRESPKPAALPASVGDEGAPSAAVVTTAAGAVVVRPRGAPSPLAFSWPAPAPRVQENDDASLELAREAGAVKKQSFAFRQRWSNRAMAELGVTMAAFLLPAAMLHLFCEGRQVALFMPVAMVVSSLLVLAVAQSAPAYVYEPLKRPRLVDAALGVAGALVCVGLAVAWMTFVKWQFTWHHRQAEEDLLGHALGLPMALFAIAFCPAIFEELAFRGLLYGRLCALFGTREGIIITSIAFAVVHGNFVGFPILLTVSFLLGWLRWRSGSLVPGMLLHFVYNGTLVWLDMA